VSARYFSREDEIGADNPCAGAQETPYLYFFQESGRWGVLEDDDVLVDERNFSVVDEDTIAFGDIAIDHRIGSGGALSFEVLVPGTCDDACIDELAWAVATFSRHVATRRLNGVSRRGSARAGTSGGSPV
jgi:hypothetical protein